MRITPHGSTQIIVSAVLFVVFSFIFYNLYRYYGQSWYLAPIPFLAATFIWTMAFFRDPDRTIPQDPGTIVSPADGTVTHLDTANEPDYIGGATQRCSIFLSIFNVHINRAPAAGVVEYKQFRPGAFHDARSEDSLTKNQNQDIGIRTTEPGLPTKMVVRQSTGAIARTIVCPVDKGFALRRGEKYGMIKFGSRTTLMMSSDVKVEWKVKVGDSVKAGETVLAVVTSREGAK